MTEPTEPIFHITPRAEWEKDLASGAYVPPGFAREGFIHCSTPSQVAAVANRRFREANDVILLAIDASRLGDAVRYEAAPDGTGTYPHIYRVLPEAAVTGVHDYKPGAGGDFASPGTKVRTVVELNATQYDGAFHWRHPATLVDRRSDGSVVTSTRAGLSVETPRGPWVDPWNTRGYYWPDRWYNVIRLEEPDGRLNGFYCNAATPAVFDGTTLRYADLQLDVRAHFEDGAFRIEVLDEDEFEEGRVRYDYSDELVTAAWGAIEELKLMIEARQHPFVI